MDNVETIETIHTQVNKILMNLMEKYIEENFKDFLQFPATYFGKLERVFENSELFLKKIGR